MAQTVSPPLIYCAHPWHKIKGRGFTYVYFIQRNWISQGIYMQWIYGDSGVKQSWFPCWWLVRVTLVVDWLFLPQNFGPVVGTYEGLLPLCECSGVVIVLAGGGGTSRLYGITELVWTFCTDRWWGMKNYFKVVSCPCTLSRHCTMGVGIVVAGGGDTYLKVKSQMTISGMINTISTFPGHEGTSFAPLCPLMPLHPGGGDCSCRWWGHLFHSSLYPHTLSCPCIGEEGRGVGIVVAGGWDTSLKVKSQMTTTGMIKTIYTFPGIVPLCPLVPLHHGVGHCSCMW